MTIIEAELRRIAADNGGHLLPEDVVAAARNNESPLHSQFQWDDTIAAHQYRLDQARQLIRVTVEYTGTPEHRLTSRVFVSLTSDRHNHGGYRVTSDVMADPYQAEQLLADALLEMHRFEAKYAQLRELADVLTAMRLAAQRVA